MKSVWYESFHLHLFFQSLKSQWKKQVLGDLQVNRKQNQIQLNKIDRKPKIVYYNFQLIPSERTFSRGPSFNSPGKYQIKNLTTEWYPSTVLMGSPHSAEHLPIQPLGSFHITEHHLQYSTDISHGDSVYLAVEKQSNRTIIDKQFVLLSIL